jgi:hypothetical protein
MVQSKRGFRIPSLPCSQNFCCAANPRLGCFAVNAVCKHVRLDSDIHQHFGSIQHRSVFLTALHSFLCSIFGGVRSHLFTDSINHPELISNQFHSKFVSCNHCQNIRSNSRPTRSTYDVIAKRRIARPEQAHTTPAAVVVTLCDASGLSGFPCNLAWVKYAENSWVNQACLLRTMRI